MILHRMVTTITSTKEATIAINIAAFETWDREKLPFPCVSATAPSTEGIFYIKIPKTASSTLAGITQRLSMREASRRRRRQDIEENVTYCKTYEPFIHASAMDYQILKRDKSKSFVWTVIRHPANRAVSHYGMSMKLGELENNDETFILKMKFSSNYGDDFQLHYLILERLQKGTKNEAYYNQVIQNILDEYNFIGIYERLDESLVVLSMIMGMGISDVLQEYRSIKNTRCDSLQTDPSWLSSGMREYLDTDEFHKKNEGDLILYDAVNKTLDATIDKLGRQKVNENLLKYKRLLSIGTHLSNLHVQIMENKTGCGVLFPMPDSDLEDVKYFYTLEDEDQDFVYDIKKST